MVSRVALAFLGCLSLVGCAATPTESDEVPVNEDSIVLPSRSSTNSDGDRDLPVTPIEADDNDEPTETTDRGTDEKPGTGTGTGAGNGGGTGTAPKPKTQSCTATNGEYKALTTITYTVTGTSAKISKMTVKVTNPNARDANDVDVYVDGTKSFNSGDTLANGQTVEVPEAKALAIRTGTKLRILTNFDRALTDPTADCTIEF